MSIQSILMDYFWFENFEREVACFWTPATGFLSFSSNNSPGMVDFSWDDIWVNGLALLGSYADSYPKYAVMLHTHPPGITGMSGVDKNMLSGWRTALGIPIYFIVVSEQVSHIYLRTKENGKDTTHDFGLYNHQDLRAFEQLLVYVMRGLSKRETPLTVEELQQVCLTFNNPSDKGNIWKFPSFMGSSLMESSILTE